MKKILIVLTVLFSLLNYGYSQDYVPPIQKIVGGEQIMPLGELATLNLSAIENKPDNLISVVESWTVYELVDSTKIKGDKDLVEKKVIEYTDKNGKTGIYFGTGITNKKMYAVVNATYLFVEKDKTDASKITKVVAKSVVIKTVFYVGKEPEPNPPSPPTPPNPPNPPTPDIPEGKFGLAKFVYDSINKNVTKDKVTPSLKYVAVYESVIAGVNAGTIKEPEALLKEVAKGVNSIEEIKANKEEWSKVSDDVHEKLWSLYRVDKKLNTVKDFSNAFEELCVGLKAVK